MLCFAFALRRSHVASNFNQKLFMMRTQGKSERAGLLLELRKKKGLQGVVGRGGIRIISLFQLLQRLGSRSGG